MQNMRNRSSYAETYGKDAEADHESSILTFKQFKDLPYVSVLQSGKSSVIDKIPRHNEINQTRKSLGTEILGK